MKTEPVQSVLSLMATAAAEVFGKYLNKPPRPFVYYYGPEPLAPNPESRWPYVRELFDRQGIDFLWPSHMEVCTNQPCIDRRQFDIAGMAYNSVLESVRSADALVANVSPFRGPHMYVGTAFAIGLATALGKPIFAWSSTSEPFMLDKSGARYWRLSPLISRFSGVAQHREDGHWRDQKNNAVENLGLIDIAPLAVATEPVFSSIEEAVAACAAYFRRSGRLDAGAPQRRQPIA